MELTVLMLNINFGKNKELMERCRLLFEYSYFVQKVKGHMQTMEVETAVDEAVKQCIRENVLKDILLKNRAEVVDMILTEYNEEELIQEWKDEVDALKQEVEEAKKREAEFKCREEEAKKREAELLRRIEELSDTKSPK